MPIALFLRLDAKHRRGWNCAPCCGKSDGQRLSARLAGPIRDAWQQGRDLSIGARYAGK